MASQPVSGFDTIRYQSPGTTLVKQDPCVIHSLWKQAPLAGTITLHDSATLAGTSATNQIISLGTAMTQEAGAAVPRVFDYQTKNGLVVVATGTLDTILAL